MIASLRGVIAAWAIAALLVGLAIGWGPPAAEPIDRALAPGFDAAAVTALTWERAGAPPIRVVRDGGSPTGWAWAAPPGAADGRAVDEVLAALRGGRWQRRADAAAAGAAGAAGAGAPEASGVTLTVERAAGPLTITLGAPLGGADQRWLVVGDHAYLVDGWLARALAPAPLALRLRRPLAAVASATSVQLSPGGPIGRITLAGSPRRLTGSTPPLVDLLLDPAVAGAIEQALAALEIVELPRAPVAPAGTAIVADRVTVRDAGPCPGAPALRAIDGTAGPGCVSGAAWERVARAIEGLARPPESLADRRPAPLAPATVALPDGVVLDLTGRARVGDRDADPAAVAELLAALGSPAEAVPPPAARPLGALTVTDRAGRAITLDLYPPGLAVRRGEPVALRLGEGALRLLLRPSAALRDLTPWREEPTTIVALVLDGTTYARGAVLGEWARQGPGRDDPAAVEALVGALAAPQVRPLPAGAPAGAPRHAVTLRVRPIGGASVEHALQIGAPAGGAPAAVSVGCPAIIDGAPLALAAEVCVRIRALAP